jgi:hypothetical protein
LFASTLASLAGSIPAGWRSAPAASGLAVVGVWLALAASALLPMTALVLVLGSARRALGTFDGTTVRGRRAAALVWALASVDALVVWGAFLRSHTHHHALAGTTFALVALGIVGALALLTRRFAQIADAWRPAVQRAAYSGAILALGVCLLALAARAFVAASAASDAAVDILTCGAMAVVASRAATTPATSRIGLPLAALLLALGAVALHADSFPEDTVLARAPLVAPPLGIAAKLVRRR